MSRSRPAPRPIRGLAAALLVAALAGCASPGGGGSPFSRRATVLPVVAVMDFENKANASGHWNLGHGMAEAITTALIDTKRVTIAERQNLGDVVGEIVRQNSELFRPEGKVARGRLINAQYVIRGAVTDFTITQEGSAWIRWASFGLFGRGANARVAIHLRIDDVESGEVIRSVKADGNATSTGVGGMAEYKDVAFGGDAFYRTPLGHATEQAIGRAVNQILKALPKDSWTWKPRVAEAADEACVVNGGKNVGLKPGARFLVRESPRAITDPVTGNVLERLPGRVIGRITVTEVRPLSSTARVDEGRVARNDVLERIRD